MKMETKAFCSSKSLVILPHQIFPSPPHESKLPSTLSRTWRANTPECSHHPTPQPTEGTPTTPHDQEGPQNSWMISSLSTPNYPLNSQGNQAQSTSDHVQTLSLRSQTMRTDGTYWGWPHQGAGLRSSSVRLGVLLSQPLVPGHCHRDSWWSPDLLWLAACF